MRQILHAHRDGKYSAIDNPGAVVVDYGAQMIRVGLDRWPVSRPQLFRFIAFMLRSADHVQHRAAIGEALGNRAILHSTISEFARSSAAIFTELGMVLETVYGTGGYQLHTEPRETLACCKTLAPGLPLPSRWKSIPNGHGEMSTTPVISPSSSTRRSPASSRARRSSPTTKR